MFGNKKQIHTVSGYPQTTEVSAKKLKSGQTIMVNGTNAFTIPPLSSFAVIKVEKGAAGESLLVGKPFIETEQRTVLASFGNEEAAGNAHSILMKSFGNGLASGRMSPWIKIPLILVGAWIALGVLASGISGGMSAVAQASAPDTAAYEAPLAQGQVAQPETVEIAANGGYQPIGERSDAQTLAEMANGGYRFAPQIAVPQIQAPKLECAPLSN